MGCDVCYTNHAEADQDDMDTLLTLLAAAGVNFIMGVPGADDIMLNYQSTSFHDALATRQLLAASRARVRSMVGNARTSRPSRPRPSLRTPTHLPRATSSCLTPMPDPNA